MSTITLLETLREAQAFIAEHGGGAPAQQFALLGQIKKELAAPPGLTITQATSATALAKGHQFELELPSGHHISLPATVEALVALRDILAQRQRAVESARSETSRRNVILSLGVGSKASPIQYTIDKALLKSKKKVFDEEGKRRLSDLSESELDDLINGQLEKEIK